MEFEVLKDYIFDLFVHTLCRIKLLYDKNVIFMLTKLHSVFAGSRPVHEQSRASRVLDFARFCGQVSVACFDLS